ncbi:MAG TPA: CAP domain-containing protein, partial [Candidatus Limnocylindria bacterium]|nr:CAP domain-containing protein [Candidatus Limnocylindria bacterium]
MEYVFSIIGLPENILKRAFAPLGNFALHIHDHFIPHARNNYHPHILGHRSLALFSGLLVAVKIFTIAAITLGPIAPAFSSAITPDNIINLTNESRQQFALAGLKENSLLDKAAQAKADDMLAKGYFAHNSPDGKTPWDFIQATGYGYLMAGENLAVNFSQAEDVETAWMNSPGHKANILNKNFEEIGIGVAQGQYQGNAAIFVVQEFGTPVAQKVAMNETPTPVLVAAVPPPQPAQVQTPPPAPVKQAVPPKSEVLPANSPAESAKPAAPEVSPRTPVLADNY